MIQRPTHRRSAIEPPIEPPIESCIDSRPDTYAHIFAVQGYLVTVIGNLMDRVLSHDASKLRPPEKDAYDTIAGKKRAGIVYGSDEYRAMFAGIKPAIDHHYAENAHHPEHWSEGIRDMSLLDLTEMLCDWVAASKRHNGNVRDSMDHNQQRFGFSDELKAILLNTLPLLEDA